MDSFAQFTFSEVPLSSEILRHCDAIEYRAKNTGESGCSGVLNTNRTNARGNGPRGRKPSAIQIDIRNQSTKGAMAGAHFLAILVLCRFASKQFGFQKRWRIF
jgi:hypothetical protein